MANIKRDSNDLLPLPDNVWGMLMVLSDGKVWHGYALNKKLGEETGNRLGAVTLYRTIYSMLENGLIDEVERPAGETSTDERRRYYQISGLGQRVVKAQIA